MGPNTHSSSPPEGSDTGRRAAQLATQAADHLTDTVRVEQARALRRLADRLEGHGL